MLFYSITNLLSYLDHSLTAQGSNVPFLTRDHGYNYARLDVYLQQQNLDSVNSGDGSCNVTMEWILADRKLCSPFITSRHRRDNFHYNYMLRVHLDNSSTKKTTQTCCLSKTG